MKTRSVVHSDSEILGGMPVLVGTRVPIQALIDYLEGGHSLDDFPHRHSRPRDRGTEAEFGIVFSKNSISIQTVQ